MNYTKVIVYLNRRAENWVSTVVLIGIVLITITLIFSAVQANALGERLADKAGFTTGN